MKKTKLLLALTGVLFTTGLASCGNNNTTIQQISTPTSTSVKGDIAGEVVTPTEDVNLSDQQMDSIVLEFGFSDESKAELKSEIEKSLKQLGITASQVDLILDFVASAKTITKSTKTNYDANLTDYISKLKTVVFSLDNDVLGRFIIFYTGFMNQEYSDSDLDKEYSSIEDIDAIIAAAKEINPTMGQKVEAQYSEYKYYFSDEYTQRDNLRGDRFNFNERNLVIVGRALSEFIKSAMNNLSDKELKYVVSSFFAGESLPRDVVCLENFEVTRIQLLNKLGLILNDVNFLDSSYDALVTGLFDSYLELTISIAKGSNAFDKTLVNRTIHAFEEMESYFKGDEVRVLIKYLSDVLANLSEEEYQALMTASNPEAQIPAATISLVVNRSFEKLSIEEKTKLMAFTSRLDVNLQEVLAKLIEFSTKDFTDENVVKSFMEYFGGISSKVAGKFTYESDYYDENIKLPEYIYQNDEFTYSGKFYDEKDNEIAITAVDSSKFNSTNLGVQVADIAFTLANGKSVTFEYHYFVEKVIENQIDDYNLNIDEDYLTINNTILLELNKQYNFSMSGYYNGNPVACAGIAGLDTTESKEGYIFFEFENGLYLAKKYYVYDPNKIVESYEFDENVYLKDETDINANMNVSIDYGNGYNYEVITSAPNEIINQIDTSTVGKKKITVEGMPEFEYEVVSKDMLEVRSIYIGKIDFIVNEEVTNQVVGELYYSYNDKTIYSEEVIFDAKDVHDVDTSEVCYGNRGYVYIEDYGYSYFYYDVQQSQENV